MYSAVLLLLPHLALPAPHPGTDADYLRGIMDDAERSFFFGDDEAGEDYEVTSISPAISQQDGSKILTFSAHGKDFHLTLRPNHGLLAPQAVVLKRTLDSEGNTTELEGMGREETCHHLHQDSESVAALSLCSGQDVHGVILEGKRSLEILPLPSRLKRMMNFWKNGTEVEDSDGRSSKMINVFEDEKPLNLHLVRRTQRDQEEVKRNPDKYGTKDYPKEENDDLPVDRNQAKSSGTIKKRSGGNRLLETAVFLDAAAYLRFSRYFMRIGKKDVDIEIKRLILSYLNGIQAIYMLSSLGEQIDFSIVRLELTRGYDPYDNGQGDREPLLNSFCAYQEQQNPGSDTDPGHWDLALLVSGLNFYAVDGTGRKNGVTMGLARVGGMCTKQHNCVIGELGVTNTQGKPYPSAGFTAVYVMAHEVGHNLGMHHDSTAGCDKNGFIMSSSRGTKGETTWSSCSVNALHRNSNLGCLDDDSGRPAESLAMEGGVYPGEVWSALRQCQIFLLDSDAKVDHTDANFPAMCQSIKCRTPTRAGYYRSGPALEGTSCGDGKWCQGGSCIPNPKASDPKPGEWSQWVREDCRSGCTEGSRGYREKRRSCLTGRLVHSLDGCQGPSSGIEFCEDTGICQGKEDSSSYATRKCQELSSYVKVLDPNGEGTQVSHSDDRLWQACSIYCKKRNGGWYTPRMDLNDQPDKSPYFPDGTLCHTEGDGSKYYCQRTFCLEENSRVAKSTAPDLNLLLNALPGDDDSQTPEQLKTYFSLNDNLDPVGGQFAGLTSPEVQEDDWSVMDYIE